MASRKIFMLRIAREEEKLEFLVANCIVIMPSQIRFLGSRLIITFLNWPQVVATTLFDTMRVLSIIGCYRQRSSEHQNWRKHMRTVWAISKFLSDHGSTTCRFEAKASTS
ncbi:uncharacterized protein [Elaeis guineensis]|uniref:uncharacterized protein n=1 Tax=Elaeis guineensis var. tenera TaxID=51953 RepID=UPI003C6CD519